MTGFFGLKFLVGYVYIYESVIVEKLTKKEWEITFLNLKDWGLEIGLKKINLK